MVQLIGFADMGYETEDQDSEACPSAPGRIEIQLIEVGKAAADLEGESVIYLFSLDMLCLKYLFGT